MKLRKQYTLAALLGLALLEFTGCKSGSSYPYMDTNLSFEERTEDLVNRMTLEEKADMLRYDAPAIDRLGIPAYNWWNECLHGVARSGQATVFPQAIGMAAMWDKDGMFRIADIISDEARAKHHDYVEQGKRGINKGLTFWTPNINIFRDPRWGRGMETYGEDPYLTGELAVFFIKGLQGNDPRYFKLIATSKHFAVHSGPESTRHSADVWPSEYDIEETYLPHFRKTIAEANVYSVMCAYQRLNGTPCCGSGYLNNLLRNEWGFEGYIVSDCWAVRDFYEEKAHHVVNTPAEAAAMAVRNGTDLNCGDTYLHLVEAVKQGLLSEEELDVSVRRVMLARMRLGIFDPEDMVGYAQIPIDVVDSKEHQQAAVEAARKSIVLLKNENNTLPLRKDLKRLAVIGPNADDLEVLLGNYNGFPTQPKTPLTGIREKLPNMQVDFAQGCPLAEGLPYLETIPADFLYTDEQKTQKGLRAEYYANHEWEGKPAHTRIDENIDFIWRTTPPFENMKYDNFSVRWTGVLVPPVSGRYAIGGEGYTGFNLYLDDKLVAKWYEIYYPHKEYEFVTLEAGKTYHIRFEYTQNDTEYSIARLLWDTPKPDLKQEAIELAKASDAVILCMGLSPLLEGEDMPVKVEGFDSGDRLDIKLPAVQTELMHEIAKLGKPTVLVLLNGSAVAFNWEAENIPAILEAWYPGQGGGTALADIIFGDYNPSGRLPLTFYKSIDQLPPFDDYNMEGKTYRYFRGEPLYEFGYGLSYTDFSYSDLELPAKLEAGQKLKITTSVTNTGQRDGEEVVQLYVSFPESNFKTSIRSLQGFERVYLKAGETKKVEFTLLPEQMAVRDNSNTALINTGQLKISVGSKQPDKAALKSGKVIEKTITITGEPYYMYSNK